MKRYIDFLEGKNKPTLHHVFLIDKSGSMGAVRDVTFNAINKQIKDVERLKKEYKDHDHKFTLLFFDDSINDQSFRYFNADIENLKELQYNEYIPHGWTALNDAIGTTIEKISLVCGDAHANPLSLVLMSVFTDGKDNKSIRYSEHDVKRLIKNVEATNKWTIVYAGANHDVTEAVKKYGIDETNSIQYTSSEVGTQSVFDQHSLNRDVYLKCALSSTDSDRTKKFFKKD